MIKLLSVIIPTYNPAINRLNQTINGLKLQTLPVANWELIIIDNNSDTTFNSEINIDWQPNCRIIAEPRQGLTYARLAGFAAAKGDAVVMVDDDNILDEKYLAEVVKIFNDNPKLGAIGGKSIPLFEAKPPAWLKEFYGSLALRDLGNAIVIDKWENKYPGAAPIGAGMGVRKEAIASYISKNLNKEAVISDRTGNSLSSGGDNDMIIEILKQGWFVGYFPSLVIQHIIPEERMRVDYLSRLVNNTNKSWVKLLATHHISLWKKIAPWTVPARKLKAWLIYKAWKNEVAYIKWQGACGMFEGLSEINEAPNS